MLTYGVKLSLCGLHSRSRRFVAARRLVAMEEHPRRRGIRIARQDLTRAKIGWISKNAFRGMTFAFPSLGGEAVGAEDLQGDDPGRCFVDAQRLANVSDPEMDMNRAVGRAPRVGTSRLVAALRWLAPGIYTLQTPRRSVDRELDEFSSPWD